MNVDGLNSRYGAPGRIVFRAGHCGYPEVVLASRYGVAEVALLGANVLSYRPTGHSPVLFRPEKRDYNRGESFHGGIPVCWPQFGRVADPTLPQHGFARLMPFEVKGTQYSEEMSEVTLVLRDSDETRRIWPHSFELEYTVTVSMKLNLKLVTANTGDAPLSFSTGLHPYLKVRERDGVVLRGVAGLPYVYAEDMSEHVQEDDLAMTKATDHVFSLPPSPKHEFALLDSGLRRAIAVASSSNERLVVWNPGEGKALPDFKPDDWRGFVCVEPVSDWPGMRTLAPGARHEMLVAIQATQETST